jgi:mono/diheme cytochrome c family protein
MENPGAILAFTYEGEGSAPERQSPPAPTRNVLRTAEATAPVNGPPPQFTAEQAAAGKAAYDSNCAVCHGSTLTNGTFAPPLAGGAFKTAWSGRAVRALYDKGKTMPPAAPGSLPSAAYANILAYILDVNGARAGQTSLKPDNLDRQTIP